MDNCLNCSAPLSHTPGRRPKKFCSSSCRVKHCLKKKKAGKEVPPTPVIVPQKPKTQVKDLTKPTNEIKPAEQPKTNYTVNTAEEKKPRNLDELKALCPPELTGFDRSNWVATERQKYGI